MTIREYLKGYTHKSDIMGAMSLALTLTAHLASLALGAVSVPHVWPMLPCLVVFAFSAVRLYVLQHDCGHESLFATRWLNDAAGHFLSVFSFTPYRVMQYNHNQHHAYLGNLEHRETTEIHTMTLGEWENASFWERLSYRVYRFPPVMLIIGGVFTYFVAYRWPKNTLKIGLPGVLIHNFLLIIYVSAIWWVLGAAGLAMFATGAILASAIGVFLVYLQHNFEDTYWDRKPNLDFRRATLAGSSSLDLGHWWDIGTGNIAYHDLHHFMPSIPSYNLRKAQKNLPEELKMHDVIRWPRAIASFRLKLWDEQSERLVPFPKKSADIMIPVK